MAATHKQNCAHSRVQSARGNFLRHKLLHRWRWPEEVPDRSWRERANQRSIHLKLNWVLEVREVLNLGYLDYAWTRGPFFRLALSLVAAWFKANLPQNADKQPVRKSSFRWKPLLAWHRPEHLERAEILSLRRSTSRSNPHTRTPRRPHFIPANRKQLKTSNLRRYCFRFAKLSCRRPQHLPENIKTCANPRIRLSVAAPQYIIC